MKETKLFELVTCTEMIPWLALNMLPNVNTCENGWLNFSANLRVLWLKLLELTQFACPNLSIYLNFLCAVPRDDVIESTRFLMRPTVNHSTMVETFLFVTFILKFLLTSQQPFISSKLFFTGLNFGQILHVLNNELKIKFGF